jgi:AcrR family transcriptional regulator
MSVAKDEGPAAPGVREQKKRETQRLLTQTGMRLFLDQGYNETTLDQIAAQAGVSRRTIFSYFASKEDILVASSDAGWDDILGDIGRASREEDPLQVVCSCLLQRVSTRSNQDLLALRELMLLSATLRSRGQAFFVEREHAVAAVLSRVWPEPEMQWQIRLAAMAGVGAFRLAVDTWRDGPEQASLQALAELSFARLKRLLRAKN